MNKVSIPDIFLVAAVAAVILSLIRFMPPENNPNGGDSSTNPAIIDPRGVTSETVDEFGRWVVMLGEVELRIPKEIRSQPPAAAYDRYATALCLREQDELGGPGCSKQADRIRIFLMARPIDRPPPNCNVDRDYNDELLDGPFTTGSAEVELYRSESKTTRIYVYRIPSENCWHPTADCSPLRCLTSVYLRPGVIVRYEFSEISTDNWPAIHNRVINHVTPLVAWQ